MQSIFAITMRHQPVGVSLSPIVSLSQAATIRNVHRSTILRAIKAKAILAHQTEDGQWLIQTRSLLAFSPRNYRTRHKAPRVIDPFKDITGETSFYFKGMAINELALVKGESKILESGKQFMVPPHWRLTARLLNRGLAYRLLWKSPTKPQINVMHPFAISGKLQKVYVIAGGYVSYFFTIATMTDEITGETITPCSPNKT